MKWLRFEEIKKNIPTAERQYMMQPARLLAVHVINDAVRPHPMKWRNKRKIDCSGGMMKYAPDSRSKC